MGVWGWRVVRTNTVGGLISLKWPQKKGKSRDLQQMMAQFRMRSDYLDVNQCLSELWRLISGISEESGYHMYSVGRG